MPAMPIARVEFTIEPFEVGAPGPHVSAAAAAAEDHGGPVEVGPFATSVAVPEAAVPALVHDVVRAALDNGATRIALQIERADP
jgi:hypothetical protein